MQKKQEYFDKIGAIDVLELRNFLWEIYDLHVGNDFVVHYLNGNKKRKNNFEILKFNKTNKKKTIF